MQVLCFERFFTSEMYTITNYLRAYIIIIFLGICTLYVNTVHGVYTEMTMMRHAL